MTDDPLDRLAADEDWSDRARAVEDEVARQRRRNRVRAWRLRAPSRVPNISRIFIGLVALAIISGWLLWAGVTPVKLTVFVFVLSAWLVVLCLHEFSHALTAHRHGDHTVAGKGYLRLDIRTYGHPLLTWGFPLLFLVMGGIPLPGGAVMIETHRLRGRFASAMVSAAGPAINILAAIVLLTTVSTLGPDAIFDIGADHAAFWAALTFLAFLQVATAILNLVPIPGVDGYGILEPFLPYSTQRSADRVKPYGLILLFLLFLLPPVRAVFSLACYGIVDLAGAPINGDFYGYYLFRFWQ
jgi:Zn-dependent protease